MVPETLEPSLLLAAAVLNNLEFSNDEVTSMINSFRRKNLEELKILANLSGTR